MEEVWKDIVGYEGYYQVSNLGRIKSLYRELGHSKNGIQKRNERILSPSISKKGYNRFKLQINNISKQTSSHREVAKAFIPNPNNYPCVLHKVESFPCNDNVDNLWWGTNDDNIKDKMSKGRYVKVFGKNHPMFGKVGELNPNFGKRGKLSGNFGKVGILSNRHKKILNNSNGVIYCGVREAAMAENMSVNSLNKKLNGQRKNNTSLIYI
jgi:hypothetical protein